MLNEPANETVGSPVATVEKTIEKTFWEKVEDWFKVRLSFIAIMVMFYGLAMVILIVLLDNIPIIPIGDGNSFPLRLDVIWLLGIVIYTALGIKTKLVGGSEIGSKFIFGRPTYDVKAGLIFVPPFICRVETLPGTLIGVRIGTKQVVKDKDGKIILTDETESEKDLAMMFQIETPFRVSFAHPEQAEYENMTAEGIEKLKKGNPLNEQLTTDPVLLFIWRIQDATRYILAIGDKKSVENTSHQIGKVGQGRLSTYCAQHTAAYTSFNQTKAEKVIRKAIEELIGENKKTNMEGRLRWGIALDEVNILTLGFPSAVNHAIAEARAAGFEKQKLITLAEAKEEQLALEGVGQGKALESVMRGKAKGVAAMAEQLKTDEGREALRLETVQETLGGETTTFFMADPSNPSGNLLGTGLAIGKAVIKPTPTSASKP